MAVQDIYLSPRNIISYLCKIEEKVSHEGKTFQLYQPSTYPTGEITSEQLIKETELMLHFVGLNDFKADVKYAVTEAGVGGNISLNDSSEKTVHINISNDYQKNWKATLAVLAHEICHKLLYVNGLYCPPPFIKMNEVYVDLTTMYVGFGQLILDGYITHTQNTTSYLGYLQFDMYKITHLIVNSVLGNNKSDATGMRGNDFFADTAIERWDENPDKLKVLNRYFARQEKQLAEFFRNISVLEQILRQCKKDMAYDFDRLDGVYFKKPNVVVGKIGKPIAAFSAIYEYEFHERNPHISKLNKAVEDALYEIFLAYQTKNNIEINYDFCCPFCGDTSKNTIVQDKSVIKKCPSCGRYYTFNGVHWNVTKRQREIDEERREREQSFNEELNKRERIIKYWADEKVEEIRKNEQQRCRDAILKSIPSCLRWMVAKYIKVKK